MLPEAFLGEFLKFNYKPILIIRLFHNEIICFQASSRCCCEKYTNTTTFLSIGSLERPVQTSEPHWNQNFPQNLCEELGVRSWKPKESLPPALSHWPPICDVLIWIFLESPKQYKTNKQGNWLCFSDNFEDN